MTAYREQGRTVDETVIEETKIREREMTKRAEFAEKMKARAVARAEWMKWYDRSDAPGLVLWMGTLAIVGTACAVAIMFCVHTWWPHG